MNRESAFFSAFCSQDELARIENVATGPDHLLRLRAETIADHMRLFRVYLRRAQCAGKAWSLESCFTTAHYDRVIESLTEDQRQQCGDVTFGDIFSTEPNGVIFESDYGPMITISDSLSYFLWFAQLAILEFGVEVPMSVRFNALRIALRIMLQKESMDFDLDPRGIVPAEIESSISDAVSLQLQFIAGHEFAHYLCGHLSKQNLIEIPLLRARSCGEEDYLSLKTYNNSQKDEFEADVQSILLPNYSEQRREQLLNAALTWFGCLDLVEFTEEILFPAPSWKYQTHPTASDRYRNLLAAFPSSRHFESEHWRQLPDLLAVIKDQISSDIAERYDEIYDFYGSVYLDEPNTAWRGRELIDRVDF